MPQSTWEKSGKTYEVDDGLMQAVTTINGTDTETEPLELRADGRTWFEVKVAAGETVNLYYTTKRNPSESDLGLFHWDDGNLLEMIENYNNAFSRTVTMVKFAYSGTPTGSTEIIVTQEKERR